MIAFAALLERLVFTPSRNATIAFLRRYWEVYVMHVDYMTEQTAEKRRQNVEDARKKAEYRKAHGIGQDGLFGSWDVKSDAETLGSGMKEGGAVGAKPEPQILMDQAKATTDNLRGNGEEEKYVDFDGNTKTAKKKWLGFW